ncbi:MAG: complex I subunit 1 family protein, partial [Myxococcota bacterium]
RAGIPLPQSVRDFMSSTVGPLKLGAFGARMGAAACVLAYVLLFFKDEPTLFGLGGGIFLIGAVLSALGAGALNFGSKMHAGWSKSGKITLLGTLHSAADALKMMWKEDFQPPKADGFLFSLAPIITVIPAIASFAVIPFAGILYLGGWDSIVAVDATGAAHAFDFFALTEAGAIDFAQGAPIEGSTVPMQVASLNIGVLFIFAVAGTGIIGAAIGGYASDNKYSLMGGIRAASQMVSYEVALGLTIVPCFMVYNSLRLEEMAAWQVETGWWGIAIPPLTLAFILYFASSIAETKRVPFDAPEGESELVGGYLTEYSGMKFGMFFTGEFVEVVALSALAAVLFFGGYDVPFLHHYGFDLPGTWEVGVPFTDWVLSDKIPLLHWGVLAIQVLAMLVKIIVFIFIQLTIRWSLPRFRYDQIMQLCWKGILPLALANVLVTGALILLWN